MLSIRLSRRGKKKQPTYRIIILEKAKDPQGDFLEDLGFYNPHSKQVGFKKERIKYWLSKGAQASPTVHNLLVTHKIIDGPKIKAAKKKKKKAEATEAPKEIKTPETPKPAKSPDKSGHLGGPATMSPKATLGGEKQAGEEKKPEKT